MAGFGAWFLWNLIEAPTQVITVMIDGLNNGALYALIALGYTLVYGIIELINFAHGDLFMLGTVFASYFMVKWLGLEPAGAMGWLALVVALVGAWSFCATLNVAAERVAYRRLRRAPKLAPLITAVGVSFIFQCVGICSNGSAQKQLELSVIPAGGVHDRRRPDLVVQFIVVIAVTVPLLLILTWSSPRPGRARRCGRRPRTRTRPG